ncbi:MAG: glycosyltransferase family 87 protein [Vicinamibacterales bacterium]
MRHARAWTGQASDRQLLVWTLLALVNLASALVVWRTTDFATMHVWASEWLWRGTDLFAGEAWGTDYPPPAIVVLAPIALLNVHVSAWLWALLNVVLLTIVGVVSVRVMDADTPWRPTWLFVATLFCWSASRTLLQFTILSLACALASWRLSRTRPASAGVLLALALIKPQVAAPYVLLMIATSRWRVVMSSVATTVLLWALYCLRAGVSPMAVAASFAGRLISMYSGPHAQVGVSELARLVPAGYEDVTGLFVALMLSLALVATAVRVWMCSEPRRDRVSLLLPAAGAAAVLVACRHLSYAFVTLAPAAAWLLTTGAPLGRWPRRLFWALQAGMIVDVPTAHRALVAAGWSARWADLVLPHADRVLLVVWTSVLLRLAWLTAGGVLGVGEMPSARTNEDYERVDTAVA